MKKIIMVTTVLICTLSNNLSSASYGSSKLVTYIGKSNFMTVDGTPAMDKTFTIASPGIYVLTENIASTATNYAININSNNVTLDLNGYTLSGVTNTNMHGINVSNSTNNIEIKNGTIYGVGNAAIYVNHSIHNIKISNITCNLCNVNSGADLGAITLAGSNNGEEVDHCVIDNCLTYSVVPQTQNAHGIYADNTRYLTIQNSRAERVRNIGASYTASGFHIKNSHYPTIKNSETFACEGDASGSGVYLVTCTGSYIDKCRSEGCIANDQSSNSNPGKGFGFYLENSNNGLIQNCSAINNQGKNAGIGFYQEACSYNRILNCVAQGNNGVDSSGTATTAGFQVSSSTTKGISQSCLIKDCSAIGQHTKNTTGGAAGFLLTGRTKFCSIEGCLATGNNGGSSSGYGIFLSGDDILMTTLKNNLAIANTCDSPNTAYGIYENSTADLQTFFFENTCAINADTTGSAGSDLSSGNIASIPKIGTDLDTYDSSQANIKGFNFTAQVITNP